ncbi:sulfatase-like hydrolase/transferase [Marinomonas sp. TI.3.20]|uniref:sulfatase-like hydrolase/transferase n=1 Tax=Marinomonas sp. TI.3.20 TaxID=3121296 RepID=UPI00311DBFF1
MNIFMIICDELRADALGYAGNPVVKTPHMDSLSEDSVTFTNSYCNTPMCIPSRVSLATGRYAPSHGALDNLLKPFEDEVSFYSILKDHSYRTFNHGKWHTNVEPNKFGIDHSDNGLGDLSIPEKYVSCFGVSDKGVRAATEYKKNDGDISLIIHGKRPSNKDDTLDTVVVNNYLADVDSIDPDGGPVFARLSIMDPHTPYFPSEPYASMYDPEAMDIPDSFMHSLDDKPVLQRYFYKSRGFDKLTESDYRKSKSSYYGLVTHVDDRIGRVIAHLKEKGLYDDSLIIFTSDHGTMMGEHGFVEKWGHMYEEVLKTPLLIKFPQQKHAGKKLSSFVESVDVMPTILDCLNIAIPTNVQGKSLLPYIEGTEENHKEAIYAQYFCGSLQNEPAFATRDKEWKLSSYPEGNKLEDYLFMDHGLKMSDFFCSEEVYGELYDLKNDPNEMNNLFNDPNYEAVRNKYLTRLSNWKSSLGIVADTETKTSENNLGAYSFIQGTNMLRAQEMFNKEGMKDTLKKKK